MLTIPVQSPDTSDAESGAILIIGRSENVLDETVHLLRAAGKSAGATNDFQNVTSLFDPATLSTVVFGGMVPPDMKEALRAELRAANAGIDFIQGLAGMPGLIAAQVEAALEPAPDDSVIVGYDAERRELQIELAAPQRVRVVGFWGTSFVPPEPASTTEVIFDTPLPSGRHTMELPDGFPRVGSFLVVRAGSVVRPFTVGPMPRIDLLPPPTETKGL
jgi:hypothetical protein